MTDPIYSYAKQKHNKGVWVERSGGFANVQDYPLMFDFKNLPTFFNNSCMSEQSSEQKSSRVGKNKMCYWHQMTGAVVSEWPWCVRRHAVLPVLSAWCWLETCRYMQGSHEIQSQWERDFIAAQMRMECKESLCDIMKGPNVMATAETLCRHWTSQVLSWGNALLCNSPSRHGGGGLWLCLRMVSGGVLMSDSSVFFRSDSE